MVLLLEKVGQFQNVLNKNTSKKHIGGWGRTELNPLVIEENNSYIAFNLF